MNADSAPAKTARTERTVRVPKNPLNGTSNPGPSSKVCKARPAIERAMPHAAMQHYPRQHPAPITIIAVSTDTMPILAPIPDQEKSSRPRPLRRVSWRLEAWAQVQGSAVAPPGRPRCAVTVLALAPSPPPPIITSYSKSSTSRRSGIISCCNSNIN